jgi:hypothetical protein
MKKFRIRKARRIINEKNYYEDRIIKFSIEIDVLKDIKFKDVFNGRYLQQVKRGKEERENLKELNNKKIKKLKKKLKFYKKRI